MKCKVCEKTFEKKTKTQIYCSNDCRDTFHRLTKYIETPRLTQEEMQLREKLLKLK